MNSGSGEKPVYCFGSPSPKKATSLISSRLIATDIAWRKRRSPKTLRFSMSSDVRLSENTGIEMVGLRSMV